VEVEIPRTSIFNKSPRETPRFPVADEAEKRKVCVKIGDVVTRGSAAGEDPRDLGTEVSIAVLRGRGLRAIIK
jgi:2-keto-4-pentenoate hydratase